MTKIENNIYTIAQPEDLKVIRVIINQFEYFDGYYGRLSKIKLELKYKEFTTLKDDFKAFYDTTELQLGRFSVKELSSLKRSLIMLRERYLLQAINTNNLYFNFLNDSISNLDKWVEEVINVIVQEIR